MSVYHTSPGEGGGAVSLYLAGTQRSCHRIGLAGIDYVYPLEIEVLGQGDEPAFEVLN
jgi:hypothetical protein